MRRVLATLALALLAGCGGGDEKPTPQRPEPRPPAVAVEPLELRGDAVPQPLEPVVMVPRERAASPPVLILLHGQGGSADDYLAPQLVAAVERAGEDAPLLVLPDGGEASYWHDRRDGRWAQMVLDEALDAVAEKYDADTSRVSIGGFSMGGFGALHLSTKRRFCSVSAHSPAVFRRRPKPGGTFGEAFDDRADFARTDPIGHARELQPGIWVDVGDEDPFAPAVRELAERMRAPRFRVWHGGHDLRFWLRELPTWLRFHVDALKRC